MNIADSSTPWASWIVTINGDQAMRVEADSSADAAARAGDHWRESHTDGEDRGEIASIDVWRVWDGRAAPGDRPPPGPIEELTDEDRDAYTRSRLGAQRIQADPEMMAYLRERLRKLDGGST